MEDEDKLEEVLCPTRLLTWLHPRHLLIKASMSLESTEGSEVIFLASARKNAKTQAKSTYLSNSSGLALFLHHADTFSRLVASWKLFTCRSMSMAWATGPTVRISDKASGMALGLAPNNHRVVRNCSEEKAESFHFVNARWFIILSRASSCQEIKLQFKPLIDNPLLLSNFKHDTQTNLNMLVGCNLQQLAALHGLSLQVPMMRFRMVLSLS